MGVAERGIRERHPSPLLLPLFASLVCAILLVGCRTTALPERYALLSPQNRYRTLLPSQDLAGTSSEELVQARGCCAAGARHEEKRIEACVDLYYQAAIHAWRYLESVPVAQPCDPDYQAAWQTYQRSLGRLIATAVAYGRLDPRGRLMVADNGGCRAVPIEYQGFAWKPYEFSQMLPALEFRGGDLQRYYQAGGLGVSLVAVRHACSEEAFYRPKQPFPVTAILRSIRGEQRQLAGVVPTADSPPPEAVLTFCNPYHLDSLQVGSAVVGIQRDLSAPMAYLVRESPRNFTEGFLNPGDAEVKAKLLMAEPYQPGKIPVVFIHGLWSDSMTWVDTVNDLCAQGNLYRQYQFWYFQYPTGGELLESAARLRQTLRLAREQFDPQHQDQAMERMVLVGHSMGGLVAQLQIACSSDILWRHAANRPLDEVRTTPQMREQLRSMFYFDPSPLVRRVVFIATPHRGSGMSRRLIGRVAASLVRYSDAETAQYRRLMDDNRNIFNEYLLDSRPTTVDLLEPSHPMLLAMARMPMARCVQTHSIIGTSRKTLTGEVTDGVVPVSSALQAGVSSELYVSASHDQLHRDPTSVAELMRILHEHARQEALARAR